MSHAWSSEHPSNAAFTCEARAYARGSAGVTQSWAAIECRQGQFSELAPSGRDDQPERKVACQPTRLTTNSSVDRLHPGPSEGIELKAAQEN
jgi:hypothetical protein